MAYGLDFVNPTEIAGHDLLNKVGVYINIYILILRIKKETLHQLLFVSTEISIQLAH